MNDQLDVNFSYGIKVSPLYYNNGGYAFIIKKELIPFLQPIFDDRFETSKYINDCHTLFIRLLINFDTHEVHLKLANYHVKIHGIFRLHEYNFSKLILHFEKNAGYDNTLMARKITYDEYNFNHLEIYYMKNNNPVTKLIYWIELNN